MNQKNYRSQEGPDQEIDLIELIRRLWLRRWTVIKITAVFMVLGLIAAIFGSKEYTASCQIVPQTARNTSTSSMARLASLAGINMGSLTNNDQLLSPLVYPNVLSSVAFQQELLQTPINIKDEPEAITLLTYLSDEKYQQFSLAGTVMKYTVGLPGLIIGAIKGEPKEKGEMPQTDIIILSKEERRAVKRLKHILGMDVEEKKGYITIMAQMPEPYAAAQVAESALKLLQRYITEFKIDKVQSNLEFIQGRYDELKKEYEQIQMARARYRDANQNTSTSRARTELEKLDNQYNLAYSIYSEVATQLEQAKIQVKETTPVLTVIDPVTMPVKPSKPRRMLLLIGFTFFGGMVGCGYVLLRPFITQTTRAIRKKDEDQVPANDENRA